MTEQPTPEKHTHAYEYHTHGWFRCKCGSERHAPAYAAELEAALEEARQRQEIAYQTGYTDAEARAVAAEGEVEKLRRNIAAYRAGLQQAAKQPNRTGASKRVGAAGHNGWVAALETAVETLDLALAGTPSTTREPCAHEWIDARNEVVLSGEMCFYCGATRPSTTESRTLIQRDQYRVARLVRPSTTEAEG